MLWCLAVVAGAGVLVCVQLLQPGDGEDGRDGAADGGARLPHQRPADPPGYDTLHATYLATMRL